MECRAADKEDLLDKLSGRLYHFVGRIGSESGSKSLYAVADEQEQAADKFLILNGISAVGVAYYIVDILDKHHSGVDISEVFDKSAMSAGTEHELARIVAEEFIIGSHSDGVGAGFLLGEAYLVAHAIAFFHCRNSLGKFLLE